jgi:hypothetical protein
MSLQYYKERYGMFKNEKRSQSVKRKKKENLNHVGTRQLRGKNNNGARSGTVCRL